MNGQAYTLAMYRARPGQEEAFVAAWRDLAKTFTSLPHPPLWGTLIRGVNDPSVFYSFGPWRDPTHVAGMRADQEAVEAFQRLGALCVEMTPGNYRLVEHVEARRDGA